MRTLTLTLIAGLSLYVAACGKGQDDSSKSQAAEEKARVQAEQATAAAEAVTPSPAPSSQAAVDSGATIQLEIASVGDTMTFNKTTLSVPAGSEVHLVFVNKSKYEILPHNWVLVKPGTEASVAAAGLERGVDAGYIAPIADILAFTPLAARGTTTEVTFTAPSAGTYPYICTVPGHYVMMKGVLTVTP